jgi:hypothetical protein
MIEYGEKHEASDKSGWYFYTGEGDNDGWEFKTTTEVDVVGGADLYQSQLEARTAIFEHDVYRLILDKSKRAYEVFVNKDDENGSRWVWLLTRPIASLHLDAILTMLLGAIEEIAELKDQLSEPKA